MRTGSTDILSRGHRGRNRLGSRLKKARKSWYYRVDLEGLESRTLLATIPAVAATAAPIGLTNLTSVTTNGNANSPAVAVDPYDTQKLLAVWGVDLSTLSPVPTTNAIVEGAYSNNGGTSWQSLGQSVNTPFFPDPLTIAASPPTPYTQVTDPSVGFDGQGNVYVLALQTSGAADGALILTKFNFSGNTPTQQSVPNGGIVYQWITGSDAATSPALAVDVAPSNPPAGVPSDPNANNVYIAWASIDTEPANPTPYAALGFNPNRAELVVGTPISNASLGQASLAFSGVTTVNTGGNFGPQDDSHPQLVINQNASGQITVGWEDFGTNSKASPPSTNLMSSLVQAGGTYGFSSTNIGASHPINATGPPTQGNWGTAAIYNAGPAGLTADPVSIAVGDVNGATGNDIVVADEGSNQIGELLNTGTGLFPATATTFSAGNGPAGVILDNLTGHPTAINDAAVANLTGGASVLTNNGTGNFGTFNQLFVPGEQQTDAIADGNLDGSGLSLVVADKGSSTITIFPDSKSAGAFSFSSVLSNPIAVIVTNFRGGGTNPDIAVLNANGTIQFFLNHSTPGSISFVPGLSINVGAGAVGMTTGSFFTVGSLPDLAVVRNVNNTGVVDVVQNTSASGGSTISFGPAIAINSGVAGVPAGLAAGTLSPGNTGLSDIAVAYRNVTNPNAPVNESMVAVFENIGNALFLSVSPLPTAANPNPGPDYDAGTTFPTAIAVANVSGAAFEDLIVTSNAGRGLVSVLTASPRAPGQAGMTPYTIAVNVPNPAALTDLTVTVGLVDQATVSSLSLTLIAPDGHSITLLNNQINLAGTVNTGVGLPGGNAIGVYDFTAGTTPTPTVDVGTIFDDNATRNIFDPTTTGINGNSATDYVGYFRPEGGSLKNFLANVISSGGPVNGQWTLLVQDFAAPVTGVPNQGVVQRLSLQFSTGMTAAAPATIASTFGTGGIVVGGAIGATFPTAAPSTLLGVGPGLVMAIDNTMGPDSPHEGRIYASFVGYFNVRVSGVLNPTTNTDVFLVHSDNGGRTWSAPVEVNDDNAQTDGYTQSNELVDGDQITGRTQFQPEIAVDQSTGTVVLSWRDARDDAANARVATYLTTSIDGGQTFSPETFANPDNTAINAITSQTQVLGPLPDNQSAGNPQVDTAFGYGDQMGLAVSDGHVFPIWSGNFNTTAITQGFYNASTTSIEGHSLNIWYRPMVIAAGPRIINSSMGPIPLAEAASGAVTISVTFDRPVNPATFVTGDVQVFYHDTTNGDPSIALLVTGVVPVASSGNPSFGYTQFTVTFNPSENPAGASSNITNYTGTYSYLIAPDNGSGTAIGSPIWAIVNGVFRKVDPMDENADGTSDQNAVTTSFTGLTPGDVYAAPAPQPVTPVTFFGAASILSPPFNQNTLPLIVPGPQVLSTSVPNGSGSDNLITNGTTSTLSVTFDRPMQVSTFTPSDVLQIMGPTGSISDPQYFPSNSVGQTIPAATATGPSTLDSTLTVPNFNGTFQIADITVELNVAFPTDSNLTAVLIAPDGTQVPLFGNVGGNGANFVNTIFDDSSETSITQGAAPFTGTFKPTGMLSSLDGKEVDGVWKLQITNSKVGISGILDNWSLNVTPVITVTPVNPQTVTSPISGQVATTFTIGFPQQQLSGTYTVQIAPSIKDEFGDEVDTNQNAGLAVLRDQGQNSPTTTVQYTATDLPKAIPAGQVTSTIAVPDNFLVQGDTTTSGISGLRVQINLSYPDDPNLSATLNHYDPSGDLLGSVPLFTNVGQGINTANFTSTVFDDNAVTPIQNGSAPFFGTFNPQMPLSAFAGMSVQGTWTLVISSTGGSAGTFNGWSLSFQKPLPTSGLGEPGSDNIGASFRIFTLGQTAALSSEAWTAVGPAAITGASGQVSAIAVDPSDPSGNTVYVTAASGGIWKTTDFLTTNPSGPTYIPLTDFGPTSGLYINSITVFSRNSDLNDSIIIAATGSTTGGEGHTDAPGVGFLISDDGGATWNLYDSADNVDSNGNLLPIESTSRNREFIGMTANKVIVDPKLTPTGQVIIYAAMSGTNGGIWRSEDTGQTWSLMLAGDATDVILDQESGTVLNPDTDTLVAGNLQVVYAGIEGQGVYMSPNQGQVWNLMTGTIGNPLIYDTFTGALKNVNPDTTPSPNGAEGRIVLAVPTATGNAAEDPIYEGWLYAAVSTPTGGFDGLFMTKDFGENWTQVGINTLPPINNNQQAIPTNDITQPAYPITYLSQGNLYLSLITDPTDPNIVYLGSSGGDNLESDTGLIRVDTTNMWDAHSLVAYDTFAADGGLLLQASIGPAPIDNINSEPPLWENATTLAAAEASYLNFIRNPQAPFLANASLAVYNYVSFTNNGAGVTWMPFDDLGGPTDRVARIPGTDYQSAVALTDPTTGLPRLIFGSSQGVWSVLDDNGTFETAIGTDQTPGVNRNGDLQITQFYYGAAQPSNAAAQIAGALFYGAAQDNGGPFSTASILTTGNLQYSVPAGDISLRLDSSAVAVNQGPNPNQQGLGTVDQYWFPGEPSAGTTYTDFFQVDNTGRTSGLLQASNGLPTPDPQWPLGGIVNFAVDPVNGSDMAISSTTGNIFATSDGAVNWFDIGEPSVFGSPGNSSIAIAYGAPDPSAPAGVGNLGNFIYVGTSTGQIYVTQDGGGSGTSNNWVNISTGLDGSQIESINTDPTRGSHEAYAVTQQGVYFMANSIPSATNPTPTWINITSNIHNLAYTIFGQAYNPTTDPNSITLNQAVALNSVVADWQYTIPNAANDPAGPGFHPVLYVASNSGVYQSLNDGSTWTLFPDTALGAEAEGGNLPHVDVTDLSLSIGNINSNTGMPDLAGPYQTSVFTGTLVSGSASVTGITNTAELVAGQIVSGTGIPSGTTIQTVNSSTAITLSADATASGSQSLTATRTFVFTGTLTSGSASVTAVSSTTGLVAGQTVTGPTTIFAGTLTSGSASVTDISSTTGLVVGQIITGTNIPSGTTIQTVNSSTDTITLSANATASGSQSLIATDLPSGTTIQTINSSTDTITLSANATVSGSQSLTAGAIPDPDLLLASTFGRGAFAINLAPIVFPGTVLLDPSSGTPADVTTTTPLIDGLSELTGFGSATRITIVDETPLDPTFGQVIGGFDPSHVASTNVAANWTNAFGNFSIPVNPMEFTSNGPKTIEVYATDDAGSVSNKVTLSFTLNTNLPPPPPPPPTAAPTFTENLAMLPADIRGTLANGNPVTNLETPEFIGITNPGVTITVFEDQVVNGVPGSPIMEFTLPSSADGSFSFLFQNPPNSPGQPIPNGTFQVYVQAVYTSYAGLGTTPSNTVQFEIDNTTPAPVADFRLNPADGTGIVGDNVTSDHTPEFIGTAPAGDTIDLFQIFNFTGTLTSGSTSVTGISNTTGLAAGQSVAGTDVPSGTTIVSVNSSTNTITLSANATAGGSQSLTATVPRVQNTAIAYTGTLTTGSASVTGISSTTGLVAGESVSGTGIPTGTTIKTVNSSTAITLSANATVSGSQGLTATQIFVFTGTLTTGSASVTGISSTTGLVAGESVSGTGIPSGTTIETVNSLSTITLSANATVSGSQSLTAGAPYDFSIQMPFALSNAAISLDVIVIDAFSLNASSVSNPVTAAIVSVTSDYNGAGISDPALFSRNATTNQLQWLVQTPAATPLPWFTQPVVFTGTLKSGSASVTGISSTSELVAGQVITGTGIPSGTTIKIVNYSTATITLSVNATVSGSQSLTASTPANVIPFQGDFDGDGLTDLAYYQPSTATWVMEDSKSQTTSSFPLGTPNSSVPVVGYFAPNGGQLNQMPQVAQAAEPAVLTYANGQDIWTIDSSTLGIYTVTFPQPGQAGDIPVPGDYYGLGYDQLAVYRPSTGLFLVLNPMTNQTETLNLGVGSSPDLSSLVPVPGQYNNMAYYNASSQQGQNTPIFGHTEAAVYDPNTGVFTILGPGNVVYPVSGFQPGGIDIPAPADYLGDGSTQPAVFQPTTGQFIGAGGTIIATFGQAVDIPLAAPLSYRVPRPTVTGMTPAAGATSVALGSTVTATFSEPVQSSTISFVLKNGSGNTVATTFTYTSSTNTATWTPTTALAASTTYTATVSGAADLAGFVMTSPVSWSFTTTAAAVTVAPTITSTTPAAGATGVAFGSTVTATFSEPVQSSTISFVLENGSGQTVTAAVGYNAAANIATLTPNAPLAASTTYTATMSGAMDLAGTAMTSPASWSFTTAAAVTIAPLVTVSDVQVVKNKKHQVTEILVGFSGALNAAEAQELGIYRLTTAGTHGSFTAKNAQIIKLKSATYDAANDTVDLFPKKPFALTKKVQLQVDGVPPSGLEDSRGRMINGNAVVILSSGGVSPAAVAVGSTGVPNSVNAAAVDALLELNAFAGKESRPQHPR